MLGVFKQFKHLYDYCWKSPNGVLRIYTRGMKEAVVDAGDEILDFLTINIKGAWGAGGTNGHRLLAPGTV